MAGAHHPFTSPVARHAHCLNLMMIQTKPGCGYWLRSVLNGGTAQVPYVYIKGNFRQMFRLRPSAEEVEEKFGFPEAFEYGAPPIADRLWLDSS